MEKTTRRNFLKASTTVSSFHILPSGLEGMNKNEFENVNHYTQFLDAIEGKDKTLAGFEYAGPLAESLCLGVVACQFPGQRLKWNAGKMQVTNKPEANQLLEGKYRKF